METDCGYKLDIKMAFKIKLYNAFKHINIYINKHFNAGIIRASTCTIHVGAKTFQKKNHDQCLLFCDSYWKHISFSLLNIGMILGFRDALVMLYKILV